MEPVSLEEIEDEDVLLYLSCNNDMIFSVNKKYALISNLIKTTIMCDANAGLTKDKSIRISKSNTKCLSLIIDYMNIHKGDDGVIPEPPIKHTDMKKILPNKKDAEFCDNLVKTENGILDETLLFDVTLVSNYMDMNILLHKLCAKIATQLKDKTFEEIQEILSSVTHK